jgi:hypothetical protein
MDGMKTNDWQVALVLMVLTICTFAFIALGIWVSG